eukprot:scaffold2012_cov193-Cylindrotheca_fusiformis.AAC.5
MALQVQSLQHCTNTESPTSFTTTRREAIVVSIGAACFVPLPSHATDETTILKGTVTLAPGERTSGNGALYLTCRPNKADNVPAAILNGSRGKAPPVLAAKIENPSFPLQWQLSSPRDLTPEGASTKGQERSLDFSKLWWNREDLIVSARWDSDGVAATRSPDDLVGRAIWEKGGNIEVQLSDRGAFGKFVTGSKQ